MSSTDNFYTNNTLNNSSIYLYKYTLPVLYILGNIGNLLSALIFLKKSWKKNVCVFYFKVCLVYNTFYINCNMLKALLKFTFNINLIDSNVVLCKLSVYALYVSISLLPTVLILASIDRLLISSQNVDTRLYSSKRLAYFSVSISTMFWFFFYIHLFVYVDIQEFSPSYFICYLNLSSSYINFINYSSAIINSTGCLIMIILCLFEFKNVRRIRSIPSHVKRQQIRMMNKKDFQLLRCLFVQDIIYILFSTLLLSYNFYYTWTMNEIRTGIDKSIQELLNALFRCLMNIPYCSNFFVFIIVSKAFRDEFKRGIYKLIGKEIKPMREEEIRQENSVQNNVEVNVVSTIVLPY